MHTTPVKSGVFHRVDDLPMSKSQRARVAAYIQDGELIADFFCRALETIRSGLMLSRHSTD